MKIDANEIEGIRRTLADYTVNGDRLRFEALAATFVAGGVFETPSGTFRGREAIIASLSDRTGAPIADPALHPRVFTRHNLTTCHIELTSTRTAKVRTYFIVFSAIGADHAGVYDDEMVREADGWRFAYRRVRVDWIHSNTVLPGLLQALNSSSI